jgi:predicted permease
MEPLVNVVMPVFAIVAAGYLCGARGLLGEDSSGALNLFVYYVALPALLFRAMAEVDLATVLNVPFIIGFLGPLLALWLVASLMARALFGSDLAQATLHGMNSVLGNSGFMGIPLAITAYGEAAAVPAIVATIVNAAVVPAIGITLIEVARGRGAGPGVLLELARSLATNPVLVAPLLGLGWAATGLALPVPLESFTGILGAAAAPCALFAIGLFLVGKPQSEGRAEVGLMMALKLLVHPALTALMVFVVYPADAYWAKNAVLMAALPTGSSTFVLAQAYGVYVLRTSTAILWGTVASVATISAFFLAFPPGN